MTAPFISVTISLERGICMDFTTQLGQKIKAFRLSKHLTSKELALQAQITPSMLSQIERGQATPSLNTIRLLALALDEPMYRFFFEAVDINTDIVRKGNRVKLISQGIYYESLTPNMDGTIEMMQLTLPVNMSNCQTPLGHKGEEVALVQEGMVTLFLGNETCILHAGDSVRIKSEIKHQWTNTGTIPATIIFAVSPPSF